MIPPVVTEQMSPVYEVTKNRHFNLVRLDVAEIRHQNLEKKLIPRGGADKLRRVYIGQPR
jgi:hypothetical protein